MIASTVDRLYEGLRKGPSPDCDHILGEALERAEPEWAERIVDILLERGHASSWASLIGQYSLFAEKIDPLLAMDSPAIRAGVAQAAQSPNVEARLNAMFVAQKHANMHLAYLLPAALRDEKPKIRETAASMLRELADAHLSRVESGATDVKRDPEEEHHQLVLTLHEALASYDTHHRGEVLEACLWFVDDFGEHLWRKLTQTRSAAGHAARENLAHWNSPRLARYLLLSLRHTSLRGPSGEILKTWRKPEEIAALLRLTALLEDPEISQVLNHVQNPAWFSRLDDELSELPANLRPAAPRWACNAGYSESSKTKLLASWLHAEDRALHKAAVYALASMDNSSSQALLTEVADSDSDLAPFANWCARALDADTVRQALRSGATRRAPSDIPAGVSQIELDTADSTCIMLWSRCRRATEAELGPMIEGLRGQARVWRPWLRKYLQAPDPRDRLLALKVIDTKELSWQFAEDLKPLEQDPEKHIREYVAGVRERTAAGYGADGATPAQDDNESMVSTESEEDAGFVAARQALQRAVAKMHDAGSEETDADLSERLRDLLCEVFPVNDERSVSTGRSSS